MGNTVEPFSPLIPPREGEAFSPNLLSSSNAPADSSENGDESTAVGESSAAAEEQVDAPAPALTEEQIKVMLVEAEARGRKAAEEALHKQAEEMSAKILLAQQLMDKMDAAAQEQAQEAREKIGDLIIATLRRFVGDIELFQEKTLSNAFGEIAAGMVGEREVVVRVSPEQVAMASALIADRAGWTIRTDPDIGGGMRIETERGSVDATLEVALDGVANAVEAWLKERS